MAWLVTSYHGTKAPINIIYQLCPLPLATIKRHLSAKTFEAMASLLLNLQAVPFSSAIEVLWPIALQFAPDATDDQSAVYRKTQGTYLTPRWLARRTIEYAVVSYLKQHGVAQEVIRSLQNDTAIDGRQQKRLALLLSRVTIVDPACGAGVFLSEAFYLLARWQCRVNPPLGYGDCARQLLDHQLYGVDRDPLAVGLTQAVLWFQAAPYVKDSIANIHIQLGDSLLGVPFHKTWQKVPVVLPSDGEAFHWPAAFPNIAAAQGFDIVIGNPPWEKVKLLSREFFEVKQPHLAKISTSAARHSLMDAYRPAYEQEREQRSEYARTIRASGFFEHTASNDLNLYQLFVERSLQLANHQGIIGFIIPSGFAFDMGTSQFFEEIRKQRHLVQFSDFENRAKVFADVDGRHRFAICVLTNSQAPDLPEYRFFLQQQDDLDDISRRVVLDEAMISLINPDTRTLPVVQSSVDLEILRGIHNRIPVFQSSEVRYRRLFDMSGDSGKFVAWTALSHQSCLRPDGLVEDKGQLYARVYEGRMIDHFNHRAADSIGQGGHLRRPASSIPITAHEAGDPSHLALPRFVVPYQDLVQRLDGWQQSWSIGFMDIGSSTNRRTMIATILPICAAGNKVPLLLPKAGATAAALLLANLNSFVFDYVLRQHIANITLNWFIVKQCAVVPLLAYKGAYIGRTPLIDWITAHVLELTYTSVDLLPWAMDLGRTSKRPYVWDPDRRRQLRVELDALFFILYGLAQSEIDHVMDSFPIIRRSEETQYGRYQLKNEIIAAWLKLQDEVVFPVPQSLTELTSVASFG